MINRLYIFFHAAQGLIFSEIVGIRYSAITNRDNPKEPYASFSQPVKKLPNNSLQNKYSLFQAQTPKNDKAREAKKIEKKTIFIT